MHFFNVNSNGVEIAEMQHYQDITDIEMVPPHHADRSPYKIMDRSLGSLKQAIQRSGFPSGGYNLHLKVFVDTDFVDFAGSSVNTKINAIVGHANTIFAFPSLDAKMTLIVDSINEYNGVTEATGGDLE